MLPLSPLLAALGVSSGNRARNAATNMTQHRGDTSPASRASRHVANTAAFQNKTLPAGFSYRNWILLSSWTPHLFFKQALQEGGRLDAPSSGLYRRPL